MCLKQNSVWKVIFFWAVNSYSITMIHNYIIRVEMYYKTELRLEFLAWKFEPVFWQKHCIILDCKKRWKTFKAAILSIWFLMYRFPTNLMCVLTCKEITLLTKNHSYWFLANLSFVAMTRNLTKINKNQIESADFKYCSGFIIQRYLLLCLWNCWHFIINLWKWLLNLIT